MGHRAGCRRPPRVGYCHVRPAPDEPFPQRRSHDPMRSVCRLSLMIALAFLMASAGPALALHAKPDPADAEAVKALRRKATGAIVGKDQKTFLACCDDYVDCFFLDGTLMKGKKRIAETLYEF